MKHKPVYDLSRPDQEKLKIARTEIEAVMARHDLAGVCILHTPGMAEFFYNINPSYSVIVVDEAMGYAHIASVLDRDHAGSIERMVHDRAATANMISAMSNCIHHWDLMFTVLGNLVDQTLAAEHTEPEFTPDPNERNKQ